MLCQWRKKLANDFKIITEGSTASAGIAIAHHLYPLYAALEAAHQAERDAKKVQDKAAVCVYVLKRSGEQSNIRSSWASLDGNFNDLVTRFKKNLFHHALPTMRLVQLML